MNVVMNELDKKAWGGLVFFTVALALLLFLSAWSFDYWQAWLYLIVFSASAHAIPVVIKPYRRKKEVA
jgi:hypothetical protein